MRKHQDADRAVSRRDSFKVAQVIDHRLAQGVSSQGFGPEPQQAIGRAAVDSMPEEHQFFQVDLHMLLRSSSKLFHVVPPTSPRPYQRLTLPASLSQISLKFCNYLCILAITFQAKCHVPLPDPLQPLVSRVPQIF